MKKARWLILLVVAAAITWLWVSPSRAVEGLRAAAREGDPEELSYYVDFPVLRENLKTDIKASMIGKRKRDSDDPLAGLGVLLGSTMIDGLVDTFVSPSAIAAVARGYRPNAERSEEKPYDIKRRRPNSFVVEFDNSSRDTPRLVFSRRGLGWQLTRIDIERFND